MSWLTLNYSSHIPIVFFQLMPRFIGTYHWSPIMSAVRFLPAGIAGTITAGIASSALVKYWSPKYTITAGLVLEFIASMILPFADTKAKYWDHLFVAFLM